MISVLFISISNPHMYAEIPENNLEEKIGKQIEGFCTQAAFLLL